MNIADFSDTNSNPPDIRPEDVSQVVIRELASHIDLAVDIPCHSVLQRDLVNSEKQSDFKDRTSRTVRPHPPRIWTATASCWCRLFRAKRGRKAPMLIQRGES